MMLLILILLKPRVKKINNKESTINDNEIIDSYLDKNRAPYQQPLLRKLHIKIQNFNKIYLS